jgi:hypothetical protein
MNRSSETIGIKSDDILWLVTTARNLCPQWMNPVHHANYMDVRSKLIQAFKRGTAQPAEQPRETCKWKKTHRSHDSIYDPHGHGPFGMCMKYCPFCGKKIEVVE